MRKLQYKTKTQTGRLLCLLQLRNSCMSTKTKRKFLLLTEKGMQLTLGLPKYGLTLVIFGICNSTVLHIGLDIYYLAFVCYLHLQFFNHHRYRADGILIPVLRQALSVVRHAIEHSNNRTNET